MYTLVPVFRAGEHPPKPPFWKPPFCEPPKIVAIPISQSASEIATKNRIQICGKEGRNRKSWGWISGGRPRGYPGGRPGAKTSVKPSKPWKNKHFSADIHGPKARTSMTPGGFKRNSVRKLRVEFSFSIFLETNREKNTQKATTNSIRI